MSDWVVPVGPWTNPLHQQGVSSDEVLAGPLNLLTPPRRYLVDYTVSDFNRTDRQIDGCVAIKNTLTVSVVMYTAKGDD